MSFYNSAFLYLLTPALSLSRPMLHVPCLLSNSARKTRRRLTPDTLPRNMQFYAPLYTALFILSYTFHDRWFERLSCTITSRCIWTKNCKVTANEQIISNKMPSLLYFFLISHD
jgi:hypothetical protein